MDVVLTHLVGCWRQQELHSWHLSSIQGDVAVCEAEGLYSSLLTQLHPWPGTQSRSYQLPAHSPCWYNREHSLQCLIPLQISEPPSSSASLLPCSLSLLPIENLMVFNDAHSNHGQRAGLLQAHLQSAVLKVPKYLRAAGLSPLVMSVRFTLPPQLFKHSSQRCLLPSCALSHLPHCPSHRSTVS